jgi:hypothetical protein
MEETVERLKDLDSQNERKYRKMIVRQMIMNIIAIVIVNTIVEVMIIIYALFVMIE